MAEITEAQRKWLQGLGVNTAVGLAPSLGLNSPEMTALLMKGIDAENAKSRHEAEQTLAKVDQTLAAVEAYIAGLSAAELQKSSYAKIVTEVRKRFPEAAGLSQWVKDTAIKVPALKSKLPSPKALMSVVESTLTARAAPMMWSMAAGKDLRAVNTDHLLAAYMSELPAGVTVQIAGGVVQLSLEGAALSVPTPAGEAAASAGKGGARLALKDDDFSIQVSNEGWKQFDPQLRGEWKQIDGELSRILELKANKREAEFNLAWKNLRERLVATAKASRDKITASVAYLKKDDKDKAIFKAGVDAEVDLKAMEGKLSAYTANPTVEAALEVTAAADKVAARLELTAVKSGVVVTASFERSLAETKAAIEVVLDNGNTKLAAELTKKADDLSAKLKLVRKNKDLKLAAELEKTLKDVRASIEVEYTKGAATVTGGADISSKGEGGVKVQIDIALQDGRTFSSESDKLSFTANVSNKGYKFEVAFSMGEPVETASLQDLFSDADRQIKELYRLAGDQGIRSIADAKALNDKLQEVMAPIKASADKAKTLKKKSDISASFGFSVEGEWPAGGKASAPAAMFGAKITF